MKFNSVQLKRNYLLFQTWELCNTLKKLYKQYADPFLVNK